jgi:tRNA (cytosine38-C5)-methyltransferase
MVENVFGFELSAVFEKLKTVLAKKGYRWQAFEVNPKDYGVPYSRPRMFILAKLSSFKFSELDGTIGLAPQGIIPAKPTCSISNFVESDADYEQYKVPISSLWKAGLHFDLISAESVRSCCFTKAYANYAKGGGSVLVTQSRELIEESVESYRKLREEKKVGEWWADLVSPFEILRVRYFTPLEICRIHGFCDWFKFGPETTLKQRYKLLGNSLHVDMVRHLLDYLLL